MSVPETWADDEGRTGRLQDAASGAFKDSPVLVGSLDEAFEDVVMGGLCVDAAHCEVPYPPAGHGYPTTDA